LLGVDGANAVLAGGSVFIDHLLEVVSVFIAVGQAGRGSDVSGADYPLAPHDYAATLATVTGCSSTYLIDEFQEVFVPAWPHDSLPFGFDSPY
jgi:hypothetical protein